MLFVLFLGLTAAWTPGRNASLPLLWFGGSPQGVASCGSYLVFSGRWFLRSTDLPHPTGPLSFAKRREAYYPIPKELSKEGWNHIGDIDCAGDIIYAAIEKHPQYEAAIMLFSAKTLDFISHEPVPQSHMPWVAVHLDSHTAFSSEFDNVTFLYTYTLVEPLGPLQPSTKLTLVGDGLPLMAVQGGTFYDGSLILTSSAPDQPRYQVDVKTGTVTLLWKNQSVKNKESEGVTIVGDSSMLVVVHDWHDVIDNAIIFEHLK